MSKQKKKWQATYKAVARTRSEARQRNGGKSHMTNAADMELVYE